MDYCSIDNIIVSFFGEELKKFNDYRLVIHDVSLYDFLFLFLYNHRCLEYSFENYPQ